MTKFGPALLSSLIYGLTCSLSLTLWGQVPVWQSDTVMGTGSEIAAMDGGKGRQTAIGQPFGIEVLRDGTVLITEVSHHRIWAWNPETQESGILIGNGTRGYAGDGGDPLRVAMNEPYEVREAADGSLYWVEMQNHVVRMWDRSTNRVHTVAGTGEAGFAGDGGQATQAKLNQPHSLVIDERRNCLYVADIGNHRIRKIDLEQGVISTWAGNGERRLPREGESIINTPVLGPRALAIDDQRLWVALREGHSVWSIDWETLQWHHEAGTGERGFQGESVPASEAKFDGPKGIAIAPDGTLFIVDTENHAIRVYDPQTQTVDTLSGAGAHSRGFQEGSSPPDILMNRPHGIAVDRRHVIFVGDSENHRVRSLSPKRDDVSIDR